MRRDFMNIEIQVEGGKVTITVGGQAATGSAADPTEHAGEITHHGTVLGGSSGTEPTSTGSGEPGSGTVVIGPIVIDCGALQGSGGVVGGSSGTEPTNTGTGGPPSGMLVIGPIVVGGGYGGGGGSGAERPAQTVSVHPD